MLGGVWSWGVSAPGWGVSGPGGCLLPGGVSAPGGSALGGSGPGGVCSGGGCVSHYALRQTPPHPCGQTDACKNITSATSLQTVIKNVFLCN